MPIAAVILMLGTPRARSNGPAFAVGWVAGLMAVGVIVLLVAGDADSGGDTSTAVDVVVLLFGLLLLAVAVKQWQARPRPGQTPEMPTWMAAIDQFTAGRSLGLGVLLSGSTRRTWRSPWRPRPRWRRPACRPEATRWGWRSSS